MSEPLEDVVARELPPWMRAEASASDSRSADSTGAAQLPGQQGAQQASSTEQESLQVSLQAHGLLPIKHTVAVRRLLVDVGSRREQQPRRLEVALTRRQ